jgi:hypothetical protein
MRILGDVFGSAEARFDIGSAPVTGLAAPN